MRKVFSGLITSAVSVLAITAAMPAQAQIPEGLCLPNQEMVTRLRTEGHRGLLEAIAINSSNGNLMELIIVTGDASGAQGYEVRGELIDAERMAPVLCIKRTLTDVRIASTNNPVVAASFQIPDQYPRRVIEEIISEGVISSEYNPRAHNESLEREFRNGIVPYLQAFFLDDRGEEVRIVISADKQGRNGIHSWSFPEGLRANTPPLTRVRFFPYAKDELLGARQEWPSPSPRRRR